MRKKARFYKKISEDKVQCFLCKHKCVISKDQTGICNVRKNINGELYLFIYGSSSSIAADPIEKKPLYHFHPGTRVFSIGTVGCNFKCMHCQNFDISNADTDFAYLKEISPEESIKLAKQYKCQGIAFTYNEPTITHEFNYDSAKLAKKNNLYTAYVTNGYISEQALDEISPYLDAMNIDVKAFTEDFYKKICKAKLQPVLDTCIHAKELGIHIELTYLVIPAYNDSIEEIQNFCRWVIKNLGDDIAIHFSRFHPDYNMKDVPATPMNTMEKIYETARKEGILFTYLGNVVAGNYENTFCPNCGEVCIKRNGFNVKKSGLKEKRCRFCGSLLPIVEN